MLQWHRRLTKAKTPSSELGEEAPGESPTVLFTPVVRGRGPGGFDQDALMKTAEEILPKLLKCCGDLPSLPEGILFSEGLALLSAVELARVDVVIESGTANGQSTEMMARFLKDRDIPIYTIDSDDEGLEAASGNLSETARRLRNFSNVNFIRGDSFEEIPKLLHQFRGKRIGIFVDGPKADLGMQLCLESVRQSADVQFVGQHDISPTAWGPHPRGPEISEMFEEWGRAVVLTFQPKWRSRFAHLDGGTWAPAGGWGLGIFAGSDVIPLGTKGDDRQFLGLLQEAVRFHRGQRGGRPLAEREE